MIHIRQTAALMALKTPEKIHIIQVAQACAGGTHECGRLPRVQRKIFEGITFHPFGVPKIRFKIISIIISSLFGINNTNPKSFN